MKTVDIADLKTASAAYLQMVRNGEEVLVKDRNQPVARLSPYRVTDLPEEERQLVATGVLKVPERPAADLDKFWDEFWAMPSADLSAEDAVRAVVEEREEGR